MQVIRKLLCSIKSKSESDLKSKLDKISKMAKGKYAEHKRMKYSKEQIDAFNSKAKGCKTDLMQT